MPANPDLMRGALQSVIFEVIANGATYGYEIARAIERVSGGELLAQEGTLYPALHRLEKRGYLKATWKDSPEGRRRKHYRLTALGRRHREASRREWTSFSRAVNRILGIANTPLFLGLPTRVVPQSPEQRLWHGLPTVTPHMTTGLQE